MNHAGVAPLPARAARAMREWVDQAERSVGTNWARWNGIMRGARGKAAKLLHCGEDSVAFIHNTTHGLLILAHSINWRPGDNIVTAEHEFPANVYPWKHVEACGVALRVAPERDLRFRVEDFATLIDDRTRLVSVSMVQYSTGYRMPVEELGKLCRERGILFCIDGIQACGAMPIDVGALECDFFVADGHKWMLGPEGFGLLYVAPRAMPLLNDSMTGWAGRVRPGDYHDTDQPLVEGARRFEEGSHAMSLAVAFDRSIGLLLEIGADEVWRRIEALTARLETGLRAKGFEIVSPRGEGERSGSVAFRGDGIDPQAWFKALGRKNIHIAARRGCLRVSPHFYNQPEQIDRLLEALEDCRRES